MNMHQFQNVYSRLALEMVVEEDKFLDQSGAQFCDGCVHLSHTDEEQGLVDRIDIAQGSTSYAPVDHICNAYGARVKHGGYHPHLQRLVYCDKFTIRSGPPAIDIENIRHSRYDIALGKSR